MLRAKNKPQKGIFCEDELYMRGQIFFGVKTGGRGPTRQIFPGAHGGCLRAWYSHTPLTIALTLTRVDSSFTEFSRTDHGVRYLTSIVPPLFACVISDQWDCCNLKSGWRITCCIGRSGASPTRNDNRVSGCIIRVLSGCKTKGKDI